VDRIENSGHEQANAMTNGSDWFYADSLDDARYFAEHHAARPANPDTFIELFGEGIGGETR
jgi:hypothetical protein